MKGLIEEPINCRDVRPVSSPVTVSSQRGEFNSSRLVDKSARTRRMPCIFKLFLSLLKYVLFGRVFWSFDFTRNIQTNFKNSKRNTIVGSVICGLELGKELNMAGKRTGKKNSSFCYQQCHCWLCRWHYQVSHSWKELLSSQKIAVISWSTVHKLPTDKFLWCSLINYCFIQKFPRTSLMKIPRRFKDKGPR